MFKNIPIIFILIHLTDNRNVALIYSVTINNKKGIVLGQGAPDVMSFLLLPTIFRFTSGSSVHFKVNFIQQRCPLNTELATLLYINKTYIKNIKKKTNKNWTLIACSSSPFNCHHLCIDFLYLSHFFKFQFSFSFSTMKIKKIKNYI